MQQLADAVRLSKTIKRLTLEGGELPIIALKGVVPERPAGEAFERRIHMHTCMHAATCVCRHPHMHMRIRMRMHTHIRMRTHMHMHMHTCSCACTHAHALMRMHMHTCSCS